SEAYAVRSTVCAAAGGGGLVLRSAFADSAGHRERGLQEVFAYDVERHRMHLRESRLGLADDQPKPRQLQTAECLGVEHVGQQLGIVDLEMIGVRTGLEYVDDHLQRAADGAAEPEHGA